MSSNCQPILVVLGAKAERIKHQVNSLPVQVVENPSWSTGMGSTIRVGMTAMLKLNPDLEAVVILLCDQPLISSRLIQQMIDSYRKTATDIVACHYDRTVGVPVLFSHSLFPKLLQLTGQAGAKQIIQRHQPEMVQIPFPEGAIDIDTPPDYEALKAMVRE